MQEQYLNVKIIHKPGERITLHDVMNAISLLSNKIDNLEARIDNLVKKNKLVE